MNTVSTVARGYTKISVNQNNFLNKMSDNGPWPECVGMTGEEATGKIRSLAPGVSIQVVPSNSMVTCDYRTDRVRIFVDDSGKVKDPPNRG